MKRAKVKIIQTENLILVSYLLLGLFGLYMNLNISSVNERIMQTFLKQTGWLMISLVVMLYAYRVIDITKLKPFIPLLTFVNLLLLFLVLFFGTEINGATRSFTYRGVNFQPSEFIRIMIILYFAYIIEKKKEFLEQTTPKGLYKYFKPLIIVAIITFVIILKQRHLSFIIISSATLFSMIWIARFRFVTLFLIICLAIVGGSLILSKGAAYRSNRMEIYSKYSLFHRIAGYDTESIQSDDYQIRESLISLSQGGLFGTTSVFGLAKNRYLPESRTDYIYSVIGEEYGFIGSMVIFLLFILIFYRGMLTSWSLDDLFLKLAGIGLTLNIFFNAFVNIGVAISALPSTGVTLPFISYGGTSLLANSLCIGLLLNITAVRKTIRHDEI